MAAFRYVPVTKALLPEYWLPDTGPGNPAAQDKAVVEGPELRERPTAEDVAETKEAREEERWGGHR